ncbi:MAG: LacI family DNA-binding transcriptional regulator [Chloroflexi bacterium]|nr:LacI family DNA-binding transcriptional regulator [Chloroflexota bacterium]
MAKGRATIADIARSAGVSLSTVSRVLSGRESVIPIGPETRARVLASAAALNYRPNQAARTLASGRSQAVAVLVHDISDPYFSEIVRGIEDVASANQYMVLVCSTDRDPVREREYLLRMGSFPTDGIILAAGGFEEEAGLDEVRSLIERGVVIVGVARHGLPIPTVRISNEEGAREMAEHLLQLGHRRIAFIAGPPGLTTANDRLAGYRQALREAGLSADGLVLAGDFTREAGQRVVPHLLRSTPRVTAVFAANDKMAIGCLAGLRAAGIVVPDEVSVVGFGDVPSAQDTEPPLTTVTIPLREIGRQVMREVLQQLGGQPPSAALSAPTTLTIRRSAAPPRSGKPG